MERSRQAEEGAVVELLVLEVPLVLARRRELGVALALQVLERSR